MSKDLNDALQRLARWEELERRRGSGESALDEAVVAVKRVVERHPELALTLTVRGPGGTAIVQVDQHEGQVRAIVHRVTPAPPSGPVAGSAPGEPRPAARLAELLREDPYLLDPHAD